LYYKFSVNKGGNIGLANFFSQTTIKDKRRLVFQFKKLEAATIS